MNCSFTLEHYKEILSTDPSKFGSAKERKQIILAHDIDLLPLYALRMARLENSLGVNATYYVLPYADFYNATSPANMEIWEQIKNMGHEIAFHYDGRYAPQLDVAHRSFCVTFNTTSPEVALHLNGLTPQPNLPAYLHDRRSFQKEGYEYIADSGGWWRNGCVCGKLEKKLIFVCHPVWWNIGTETFDQLVSDACEVIYEARVKWDDLVKHHREFGMNKC
jgi:hypothetical protein